MLEVGRELWGIEVKASRDISSKSLSGLTALADQSSRVKRRILVFLGPRRRSVNGVEIIPLEDFLAELPV